MSDNKKSEPKGDDKRAIPVEKSMPVGTTVKVVMKRASQCGELMLTEGEQIAEIKLEAGISLNWLSRALEDGLLGPDKG